MPKRTRRRVKESMEDDTLHFECSQNNDRLSDEEDEIPISTLQQRQQQLQKDNEIIVEEQKVKNDKDQKKQHQCLECGTSFVTMQRLQVHSYTHSGIKNWKCEDCEKVFATKFRLKAHSSKLLINDYLR